MNADFIHQVMLSYQVGFTSGKDKTEGYKEVMKIYRLISYQLEFVLYAVLFLIILKNITQQHL